MKTACVIGHFGFGHNLLNGQTVKTKILTEELEERFPNDILKIDTHGGIKSLFKAPFHVFTALKKSKNVIILPAHNGLRVYAPLLVTMKGFFKNRKLHYAVIGGWLAPYLESKKGLEKCLKKFDAIYVETQTMKLALEQKGFENIFIMPNCKELKALSPSDLAVEHCEPYRLCTFSRVMKEKGIEDAVNIVRSINEEFGRTVYALDIYGQIDNSQVEWFENLCGAFPEYVRYGGLVPFDKSVEVLRNYFALLFPTKFYTEGIPGTIIDAYAAGVPVISSRWESFADIIDDGVTGIGYEFDNLDDLHNVLCEIIQNTDCIAEKKTACLEKSGEFLPANALKIIIHNLGEK